MKTDKAAYLLLSIALFFTGFFVYLKTLCPTVYFGDSGELIAMIHTLGFPHPTGFPLYILLGKLFSFAPLANIGFRINLLSAVFGALTPCFIFLCLLILAKDEAELPLKILPAFVASLIFIFAYTPWSQAAAARIYTLNGFFCCLSFFLFLYYLEIKDDFRFLCLLALATGLGFGLHLSFILQSAVLWAYLLIKKFQEVKKHAAWLVFFFATGLSVYLYLTIRGSSDIMLQWQRLSSFKDFFDYITQKNYKRKMFTRNSAAYSTYFSYLKTVILREFSVLGFAVFIAGIIIAAVKKFKYTFLFVLLYLLNIILLAVYGEYADMKLAFRYFIPSYLVAVFFIFIALSFFNHAAKNKITSLSAIAALALLTIVLMIKANYYCNDKSFDYIAYYYPYNILKSTGEKAYLFTNGDNQIYPFAYIRFVEERAKDLVIFDYSNTIFKDDTVLRKETRSDNTNDNVLACFNKKFEPVFLTTMAPAPAFFQASSGLVYKASQKELPDILYPWQLFSLKGIIWDKVFNEFEEREVVGNYLFRLGWYYKALGKQAVYSYLLEKAIEVAYDSLPVIGNVAVSYVEDKDFSAGKALFEKALLLSPENEIILFNLAGLHASMGDFSTAADYYNRVVEIDPANSQAKEYLLKAVQMIHQLQSQQAVTEYSNKNFSEGVALLNAKKYLAAIGSFERDITQNPKLARSYFNIGLCYSYLKQINKAVPYYEKALLIEPKNINTLNNLGLCYGMLKQNKKAKEFFTESLEIDPNQPRIKDILSKIK